MAKQLTEDELKLRRRARRRLIGAVALTMVVVVVLPMVLDSEPRPSVQDIELRIPSPDKAGEFIPASAVSGMSGAASATASAPVATSVPIATSAPVATSASVSTSAPIATSVPIATSAPHAANQGAIHAAPSKESKPAKISDEPATESFIVQVGAYANPDTARLEANRLKKMGFKAYTEKVGDKTRVRVGPYAERGKAEKARHLLEKHGLHPVVTSAK